MALISILVGHPGSAQCHAQGITIPTILVPFSPFCKNVEISETLSVSRPGNKVMESYIQQ